MKRSPPRQRVEPFAIAGYTCFFDGCCEPVNPGGTAGFGAVIFSGRDQRVWEHSGIVEASPTTSNNVAEYLAVNALLDWFVQRGEQGRQIFVYGDSKLVVEQLWGRWKIHGIDTKLPPDKPLGRYAPHAAQARETLKGFRNCSGFWIPRAENAIADDLSKAHLRAAGVEFRIQPEA
jgi:ribonuclease HI